MEKIIIFYPAYDKRNPDPKKNYGIHGVSLKFALKGELGAIQFEIYTQWHLPHVEDELIAKCERRFCPIKPMATDLGYHSPKPMYEYQDVISENCEFLDGKPCYYDGTTLGAEPVFKGLIENGSDWLWERLEKEYIDRFGELK